MANEMKVIMKVMFWLAHVACSPQPSFSGLAWLQPAGNHTAGLAGCLWLAGLTWLWLSLAQ